LVVAFKVHRLPRHHLPLELWLGEDLGNLLPVVLRRASGRMFIVEVLARGGRDGRAKLLERLAARLYVLY